MTTWRSHAATRYASRRDLGVTFPGFHLGNPWDSIQTAIDATISPAVGQVGQYLAAGQYDQVIAASRSALFRLVVVKQIEQVNTIMGSSSGTSPILTILNDLNAGSASPGTFANAVAALNSMLHIYAIFQQLVVSGKGNNVLTAAPLVLKQLAVTLAFILTAPQGGCSFLANNEEAVTSFQYGYQWLSPSFAASGVYDDVTAQALTAVLQGAGVSGYTAPAPCTTSTTTTTTPATTTTPTTTTPAATTTSTTTSTTMTTPAPTATTPTAPSSSNAGYWIGGGLILATAVTVAVVATRKKPRRR